LIKINFVPYNFHLQKKIFLLTPPFTQLNTPYPATAYLKGFLNTKNISSFQADLGIEVMLEIFCRKGLTRMFYMADRNKIAATENTNRIYQLQSAYIDTIEAVIHFLQGNNATLAGNICQRNLLPEAGRFAQIKGQESGFGKMGMQDHAKFLATLYLEDIADFIKETTDAHFGFSRYAERLGRSANHFNELYDELQKNLSFTDEILIKNLQTKIASISPKLVCISIPFPGNLYSAFRCGQWIRAHSPSIKIAMGGGFPNTELRSLKDPRVFEFTDFISLDDGELPIEKILDHIEGRIPKTRLKRTFTVENDMVHYINDPESHDYSQEETGTPDYSDLLLNQYVSAMEIANPMHRLWSDGRWNKLTMAHGCYWRRCTFCDISLPYIKDYEPNTAGLLCNRMETIIAQTGTNGFHFVDEAAPPALMRNLAIEIIKRRLVVTWWTNIRFEKSFTQDLCYLLAASGCIAVSGGLEVASDRLLQLIDKGITVAQVANVTHHFAKAGILVHAYLMYGFPTETEQETIDSLEMVRQLFEKQLIQSAFWHQFAMTSHSLVGQNPKQFNVIAKKAKPILFADNDVEHEDPTGANHDKFSFGLKKSLHNFMHQVHIDKPLSYWFDFKIPKTIIEKNFIGTSIQNNEHVLVAENAKLLWLGAPIKQEKFIQTKKELTREMLAITFFAKKETRKLLVPLAQGLWFITLLQKIHIDAGNLFTYRQVKADYELNGFEDFELLWDNKIANRLQAVGLLYI
jgi:hypothetical protein